eukprot:g2670.t1
MSFFPKKPVARAVSLTALAIAGCGGLFFAAESGALVSWSLPYFKPWQVLTLASWGINNLAIFSGGRLDGPELDDPNLSPLPAVRYFMPAGWAFAIWGPIILGEAALALYQALPLSSVSAAAGWLVSLSPWLASAFLLQSSWCLSFREWARDAGLLWFPAALLGGTAVCLGGAHHVVRGALAAGDLSTLQYCLVHLPVSLHFGWVSCATLVNFNSYISLLSFSDKGKLNFSLASIAAAVGLGIAVTGGTGDPVYAGVVAWALSAVASEKGWGRMKQPIVDETDGVTPPPNAVSPAATTVSPLLPPAPPSQGKVEASTLETQALAAKVGAAVSACTAGKVEASTLETQALAAKVGAAVSACTAVATPLVLKSIRDTFRSEMSDMSVPTEEAIC